MASLAFGVVGALAGGFLGGPLGAQLGFLAGSTIGNLVDPQQIQGPRLSDLKVQTSSYGAMIPVVYGTVRIAGNVIDQTDLQEHEHTSGGKGGPEVTTYSYSASIDVLICAGPIVAVPRIWADGRLIYDETPGAVISNPPDFTLYLGDADQLPDPTFEAIHGAGNVPAYRHRAHIVFNDLDVSQFGNRIPVFTFEVITVGERSVAIRRVWVTHDETPVYGNNFIGPTTPVPLVTEWEGITDRASSTITVEDLPGGWVVSITGPSRAYQWTYCGDFLSADRSTFTPIWVDPSLQIGGSTSRLAGLCSAAPIVINNPNHPNYNDAICNPLLIGESDLPPEKYVGAMAFSPDNTALLICTSDSDPTAGFQTIDHWYLFKNGSMTSVADGDIDPAVDLSNIGFPWHRTSERLQLSNGMESNCKWIWTIWTAGDPTEQVMLWHIGTDGNLTLSTSSGYGQTDEVNEFSFPSCKVVNYQGYFGVALGSTYALFTRYPVAASNDAILADIVADISERCNLLVSEYDVEQLTDRVPGYTIGSQMDGRAAIEQLRLIYQFDGVESGQVVKFIKRGGDSIVTIPDADLGAHPWGSEPPPLLPLTRTQEVELPINVNVTYINRDADYQTNTQQARRMTGNTKLVQTWQVAVVLHDAAAKAAAEALLYVPWVEQDKYIARVPRKYLAYEPTDVVTINDIDMRIVSKSEDPSGIVRFDAVPSISQALVQGALPGTAEGFTPQQPPAVVYTRLQLLDIPIFRNEDALGFYVAMAGPTGWPGATLYGSPDGVTYTEISSAIFPDVMGAASSTLGAFNGGNIFDPINTVDVVIIAGQVGSLTQSDILNLGNWCVLGDEILQFTTAELIAPLTYRLSGLLRGRQGTEWAMHGHIAGERFVYLPFSFQLSDSADIGVPRYYKAVSAGLLLADADPQQLILSGNSLRPLSPVLRGGGHVAGDVTLTWTRRARIDAAWLNGHDVPLDEPTEQYVVQVWNATYRQCARSWIVTAPTASYTAAEQTTDFGAAQQTIYFTVAQLGILGMGTPAAGTAPSSGGSNGNPLSPIVPYGAPTPTPGGCVLPVPVITDLGSVTTTASITTWAPTDEWVLTFTTPATGGGFVTIASIAGTREQTRQAVLSTVQCGVPVGPGCEKQGTFIAFRYYVTANPAPADYPTLAPATTYVISVTTTAAGGATATHTVI